MLTKKHLKKVTVTLAAALFVTVSLPAGITEAASATPAAVHSNSLINSIFNKVGLTWGGSSSSTGSTTAVKPSTSGSVTPVTTGTTKQAPVLPDSSENYVNNRANKEQANLTLADQIIKTGEKYLGTPYKFGAPSGQTNVFDCSSFVQYVYGQHGIKLPRTSRQQYTVGKSVSKSQLQKGDLVFFKLRSSNGRIAHVGIYAGNNKILHTWGKGGVQYDSMSAGWLEWGYVGAKRVIN